MPAGQWYASIEFNWLAIYVITDFEFVEYFFFTSR
jgi:hypothetical protein